jgi:hypothetical protein
MDPKPLSGHRRCGLIKNLSAAAEQNTQQRCNANLKPFQANPSGTFLQKLDKLLFGGVPPLSPSHHLVRGSTHMNHARYRSLSDKLLFEVPSNRHL